MAGYSSRGLAQKLGLKEGQKALLVQAPSDYDKTLGPLPGVFFFRAASAAQTRSKTVARSIPFDFIQCFCRSSAELETLLSDLKALLATNGMVWISWPKKTKGSPARIPAAGKAAKPGKNAPPADTLGENRVRELGLGVGLVDVKVCAVDETWSGLKFVFRLKDRSG